MVGAKLANMPAHRPTDKSANLQTSQTAAAKAVNVSPRLVADAKAIQRADPALAAEVEAGKKTVHAAKRTSGGPWRLRWRSSPT
jgi:hypothetical protein